MDIAAAQWAFDRLGRVDRVDVRLAEPVAPRRGGTRHRRTIAAGLNVQRPARRGQQVEQMLAAFQFNLAALVLRRAAGGALPGLQHRRDLGHRASRRDWRAARAGRPATTVLALFLGEAAALAAAGCLVGIPLGWALARGAVALTSATVTTLYVAHAAARAGPDLDRRRAGRRGRSAAGPARRGGTGPRSGTRQPVACCPRRHRRRQRRRRRDGAGPLAASRACWRRRHAARRVRFAGCRSLVSCRRC